ncbi:MAG TPA: GntR family transcriptional regulator [Solirubrobacteraceae bacterium]|nr:GntR family transcriptional regulator [Solirubrobacteraceae bacterium]
MAVDPALPDILPEPARALIAERAYVALRDRIVTLRLPPGSVLREDELMAELGIGRTPLREAVKRLTLENLVAVRPRRGTFVTDVHPADIAAITEIRAELEGFAAQLAAERLDDEGRDVARMLLGAVDTLEREGDQDALMRLDQRVHRLTWEQSRNAYLLETLERFFTLSLRIWYVVLDRMPTLRAAVHRQSQLLEALLAGDGATARALMHEHVLAFQRDVDHAFAGER